MPPTRIRKGQRYGQLLVQDIETKEKGGAIKWRCACDCGGTAAVRSGSLVTGNTRSCGCLREQVARESMKAQQLWAKSPITGSVANFRGAAGARPR
jgi:hypothetical protein